MSAVYVVKVGPNYLRFMGPGPLGVRWDCRQWLASRLTRKQARDYAAVARSGARVVRLVKRKTKGSG